MTLGEYEGPLTDLVVEVPRRYRRFLPPMLSEVKLVSLWQMGSGLLGVWVADPTSVDYQVYPIFKVSPEELETWEVKE